MLKSNKVVHLWLFCLSISLSPACKHSHKSTQPTPIVADAYWKKENSLPFLVIGDWGRNGEFHQKDVANVMASTATKYNCSFIISTGDNFYPDGVISTTDPQWMNSFENIYNSYSLQIPWFTAFGNHDYRGSIEAQLNYSKISRRWRTT
ncbi:MAG: metallophosphoesterase, partial [Chitinophagaceae bacterium]